MSKKTKIIELLGKDTNIDDICEQLKVTKSYVYRIQREIDESEGDNEDSDQSKNSDSDGLVINPPGGSGVALEEDHKDVEEEENTGGADKSGKVGGVKKKKRKKTKKSVKVNSEHDEESTEHGGITQWIKTQWKKMLIASTLLILLIIAILSSFMRKPEKATMPPRFPVIR